MLNDCFRMGLIFRDTPHSLEEIDRFAESMNYMRQTLGEEKAKAIEESPEDFYNGNKFRYFQLKGYHRSIPFTAFATVAGIFAVGGFKNSAYIIKNHFRLIMPASFICLLLSQRFFEMNNGFKSEDYLAHNYAKYLILTRNIRIRS